MRLQESTRFAVPCKLGKLASPTGKQTDTHFLAFPYKTFLLGKVRPRLVIPLYETAEQS